MMSRLRRGPQSRRETDVLMNAGFTIVETMVVIAITGVLFVAIVGTISGRQNKVQFNQAINNIKGEVEGVINEVQSGRFTGSEKYECAPQHVAAAGGPKQIGIVASTPEKLYISPVDDTSEANCIFLGKVLQFGSGFGSSPENYAIYSIAGLKQSTNLEDSFATVVPDAVQEKPLTNGLSVRWIKYGTGAAQTNVGAVALLTQYEADTEAVAQSATTGSQSLLLVPISNTDLSSTDSSLVNEYLQNSYPERNPKGGVRICLNSGTTKQSGLLTIGGKAGTNVVSLDIINDVDCGSPATP